MSTLANHSDAGKSNPDEHLLQYTLCVYEPTDIVEIRRLPSGRSTWHLAGELSSLADSLTMDNAGGDNIYIGANPRCAHGRRGDDAVLIARTLFADFDGIDAETALKTIATKGLPVPTLAIASGHGCHAYWRLSEPMTDLVAWRKIQVDLAACLDSDPKIVNPERIMRLPGFWNLKADPVLCQIAGVAP